MALLPLDYSKAQSAADLDPSQVYNTGNIVTPSTTSSGSTWVNGVYQDELGCFGGNTPGYCGPKPIVRPTGDINFSYGWTDLYQVKQIANVLPYSGTGLRVDGYNFGFTAKNGNGWDDGRVDLLYAYVQFDGPKGTVYNDTANISYKYDWTRFDLAKTFTDPYNAADITSVRYGFVGKDNNYWAGPYGPEIRDVSFNLKFSVDPCVSDPMYSTSCPGYMEALAKLLPSSNPTIETFEMTPTAETIITETTPAILAYAAPVSQQSQPTDQSTTVAEQKQEQKQDQSGEKKGASLSTILSIVGKEQSRIAGIEQSVVSESVSQAMKDLDKMTAQAEAVAQQSSSQSQEQTVAEQVPVQAQIASMQQTVTVQTTISAASLAARSGPMQTREEEKKEEQPSQQIQDTSAQMQPSKQDESAQVASQQSMMIEPPRPPNIVSVEITSVIQDNFTATPIIPQAQAEPQMSQGMVEMRQPEPAKINEEPMATQIVVSEQRPNLPISSTSASQQDTSVFSFIPPTLIDPLRVENPVQEWIPTNYSLLPERRTAEEIEMPKIEEYKAVVTNPAEDLKDSKPPVIDQSMQSQNQTVKKNVQDNEAAGGVSLDRMAVQPAGYTQYSIALKDAAFYEPKEIYKGQKVVDNARALRQLATDKLHQEMIEQQYRR